MRWEHEAILEAMQERLDCDPEIMRVRRQTVEHPYGTLLEILVLTQSGPELAVPGKKKATYLNWHKLLSDDEREALSADAFESVRYTPE